MNIPVHAIAQIYLCDTDEVEVGMGLQVIVANYPKLAVFHLENGEFYVTNDTCTHGDASLADGEIEGYEVECPYHAGSFNIQTGAPCRAPCSIALKTYASRVVEGKVYLIEE